MIVVDLSFHGIGWLPSSRLFRLYRLLSNICPSCVVILQKGHSRMQYLPSSSDQGLRSGALAPVYLYRGQPFCASWCFRIYVTGPSSRDPLRPSQHPFSHPSSSSASTNQQPYHGSIFSRRMARMISFRTAPHRRRRTQTSEKRLNPSTALGVPSSIQPYYLPPSSSGILSHFVCTPSVTMQEAAFFT